MKQTRLIMGMPITVEIVAREENSKDFDDVFDYFTSIDDTFSTYKDSSEVSQINRGEISEKDFSVDMKTVLKLGEETKKGTNGYFDFYNQGKLDPSGLVKGWAIWNAARMLDKKGFNNYYVDAGGDIQVRGKNVKGKNWSVGIRNPFNRDGIVKAVILRDAAIATSGTYIRGDHIYNPKKREKGSEVIVSLSVVSSNIFDADRFATAAFAMGEKGIKFIEGLPGSEGYQIDKNGMATFTSGFNKYLAKKNETD